LVDSEEAIATGGQFGFVASRASIQRLRLPYAAT
jgi:hypothetical protein